MPGDRTLNIAVIIGSTRDNRFGPTPARWIAAQARQREDWDVDVIDLKEAALPETLSRPAPEPVRQLQPRLARSDAFIVVTPVYNRGYPAPLKTAIDWYHHEWNAKPVGFVSYGGIGGGLHAVEQLRLVFNEVHAATIRDTVSFANFWEHFDKNGATSDGEPIDGAAKKFLDQLGWWAHALRAARARTPYTP
ncbi:NAD(P)H-dependent FMN reductase [Lipingzhangella halophila]|uniref:NAD(P)H-dependent FMN reductase n=1 Tax=Lipingzhangella halophila TaxID=1783352 RepID=A0A7W7W407_9ACTN|nr:NAD(P)H-dependent oxidoreductase [Lipingzhangella halophila]MBB4932354.1 NAD(P)H-dependent FMN reductase [Lipingzhangella halophila]